MKEKPMPDTVADSEKRRHPRVTITKRVHAKHSRDEAESYGGIIKDISACGVAIEVDADLATDLQVDLEIEDIGRYSGRVSRTLDDGLAVRLDMDRKEEVLLISRIVDVLDSEMTQKD